MAQRTITQFAATDDVSPDRADEDEADTAEQVAELAEQVAELRDSIGRDEMATDELAAIESELKGLEDAVETCRKEEVEPALDEQLDVGDSAEGVVRAEGHNKFVFDEEATIEALEEADVDPLSVAKIKGSDVVAALEDVEDVDPSDHVGRATYTYYRRT